MIILLLPIYSSCVRGFLHCLLIYWTKLTYQRLTNFVTSFFILLVCIVSLLLAFWDSLLILLWVAWSWDSHQLATLANQFTKHKNSFLPAYWKKNHYKLQLLIQNPNINSTMLKSGKHRKQKCSKYNEQTFGTIVQNLKKGINSINTKVDEGKGKTKLF